MSARRFVAAAVTAAIVMGVAGTILTADLRSGLTMGVGALTAAAVIGLLARLSTGRKRDSGRKRD